MKSSYGFYLDKFFWKAYRNKSNKMDVMHVAIYFYAKELCNLLKWRDVFGLPSKHTGDFLNICYKTYLKKRKDLERLGLLGITQESTNDKIATEVTLMTEPFRAYLEEAESRKRKRSGVELNSTPQPPAMELNSTAAVELNSTILKHT